jgi:phosphoribosylformimino-5-aminoimidazole carboxamide ribotide isomerase
MASERKPEIIPAVDVLDGHAVRLLHGDFAQVTDRRDDPFALAAGFAEVGYGWIHLVDLDGARSGRIRPDLVRAVAAAVGTSRVQASGGVRSVADAEELVTAGASRVVVGTAALPDPRRFVDALGDRLVVALDVRDGRIAARGWVETTALGIDEAVDLCRAAGVSRVLCTAIDRDGTLSGPDLRLLERVARPGLGVLAAGGIRPSRDLDALAAVGVEAAIVGRALLAAALP